MALIALRSRRLLPTITTLISRHFTPNTLSHPSPLTDLFLTSTAASSSVSLFQSRSFKSTAVSFLSSRNFNRNDRDDDKLDPNEILFEGCDYNHWLITMDFPKDPKPSAEEMVETYVQTCAKGLNISAEEAKKKIYACSTTTYQGFQAIMTEAESEQFQGLPGVVFILPDSYIDPVNKEYGGDKYIDGTIIPRPPPVQYNRGRNDRNNRPRYDNQRGPPGNYNNQQGTIQGDSRNFNRPQNMPPQNFGPSGQLPSPPQQLGGFSNGRREFNFNQPGQGNDYPQEQRSPGQVPPPPPPGGFSQGGRDSNFIRPGQGNYYPQEQRGPPPGNQSGFAPYDRDNRSFTPSGGFQNSGPIPNQNFGPNAGEGYGHGGRVEQGPGQGFGPGVGGNYGPRGYSPGPRGEQGPGQGFAPGVSTGFGPGPRLEQGPNQGFVPDGNFGPGAGGDGQRNQGR